MITLPLVWLVGVVLLWRSRAWTARDKLIGTLLIPGGLAYVEWVIFDLLRVITEDCGDDCSWAIWVDPLSAVLLLAATIIPIVTAIYLAKRANLSRRA